MRLIDADALMRHIKRVVAEFLYVGDHNGLFLKHDSCNPAEFTRGYESGAMEIASIVSGCATVDAVEVVRCKDCKCSGMYAFGDGSDGEVLACLTIEEDGFVRFATGVDPDHFCGYGEREDN